MNTRLTIGQLAKLTAVPPKTIRYYEEVGIFRPPERSEAPYRLYSETDVRRLDLIRRARALDMTLPEVGELVEWASSGTCNDLQGRFLEVRRKLKQVAQRIADLEHLKQDIDRLEAHFVGAEKEVQAGHTVMEGSPEPCTCLGEARDSQEHIQEVQLGLNQSRPKS